MTVAAKGIDIRQAGSQLIFRTSLKDSSGVKVTTGTTSLYIYEYQSDGTLRSYDFADNTFKTGALTTPTQSMIHQTGNNGTITTGVWTYALATLTGFTVGGVYLAIFTNSNASPQQQEREFQYGSADGDFVLNSGCVQSDMIRIASNASSASLLNAMYQAFENGTAQTGTSTTITLRSGANATNNYFKDQVILLTSGTGSFQTNRITGYVGSTKVATVGTTWAVTPDNTSTYVILGRVG